MPVFELLAASCFGIILVLGAMLIAFLFISKELIDSISG
jgi:hypothetical protein